MKLDNSVKKKVIWNTNTIGGMFHVILGWKIELSLGWCYNYFLGSRGAVAQLKTFFEAAKQPRSKTDFLVFEYLQFAYCPNEKTGISMWMMFFKVFKNSKNSVRFPPTAK